MTLVQIGNETDNSECVEITPAAVSRILELLAMDTERQGQYLRVYVTAAGCCGDTYGMSFDSAYDEDVILEIAGLKVLIDPRSLPRLRGSRVDYAESTAGSGFSMFNPNAVSGCDCGHSFSPDDEAAD